MLRIHSCSILAATALVTAATACGDDETTTTGATTTTTTTTTTTGGAGGSGADGGGGVGGTGGVGNAGGMAGSGGTAGGGGASCTMLTVKNYVSWCSVSVDGDAASMAGQQTKCVAPGVIDLTAVAVQGFILGPDMWHHTDGDVGNGEPGMVTGMGQSAESAATATVGIDPKCVWVCCPFPNGSGCPPTDQCQ
jgi:hypothetical protein